MARFRCQCLCFRAKRPIIPSADAERSFHLTDCHLNAARGRSPASSHEADPLVNCVTLCPADSAASTGNAIGSNCVSGYEIDGDGAALANCGKLAAKVAANSLIRAVSVEVSAMNPAPGGGQSGDQTFCINSGATNGSAFL
jgi:hypothetical protein